MNDEEVKISTEDVKRQLNKIKCKKAPGPDGIKPDLIKALSESQICTQELATCLNNILNEEKVVENWKITNTILIPKNNKPTPKDLRPIPLANATYKTFTGILKTKIEKHLLKTECRNDMQGSYTEKRRITDNLYILKHCIEESYKSKQLLIIISVDFQKAFDSVNRRKMITTLMNYSIHPKIISAIANIYTEDKTNLLLNGERQTEISISSGIKQGCNGSTVLFLLITYAIIQKLQEEDIGFKGSLKIPALFYADDGLIFSSSTEEAKKTIQKLTLIADDCGLKLNKEKSNILIFNSEHNPENIENIKVTENINYLGVAITNKKDCLKKHKINSINKANKLANISYSVIGRSCNRLLIGKAYWKGLALPAILHASEVKDYNEEELRKLQTIENRVYIAILQVPSYTAAGALRSEIGASSAKARDMKSKILFAKPTMEENRNDLMKEIFIKEYECQQSKWMKKLTKYMEQLNLKLYQIQQMKTEKIKQRIQEWDNIEWKRNMQEITTLQVYQSFKTSIKEEGWIDNTEESRLMVRARTNTLTLN